MSSPAITTKDFEHIDRLVKEGRNVEAMNWIVAHEAIEQTILFDHYHKLNPELS